MVMAHRHWADMESMTIDKRWMCMCAKINNGVCHAPPQFNLTELRHTHTHLMMDHDLTQSRHHHTGQCRTVSDPAISNISGHLWTGRDGALTAHAPHSATFSSTYF